MAYWKNKHLTLKKAIMDEQRNEDIRHTENKQQNGRHKYYLISNYTKCKWIKHSNFKKHRLTERILF